MKKLLLIAFIAVGVYGCKKGSVAPVTNNSALITGKWYFTLDTVKESTNGGAYKIISTQSGFNRTYSYQFNPDGTGSQFYNTTAGFNYTISGNVITFNFPSQTVTSSSGSTTIAAYTEKATIRTLTTTDLALLFDDKSVNGANTTEDYEAQYLTR